MGIFSRFFGEKNEGFDRNDDDLLVVNIDSKAGTDVRRDVETQEVDLEDIVAMASKSPPAPLNPPPSEDMPFEVEDEPPRLVALSDRMLIEALMENLTDYIFFKDRECRFTKVNKIFAERVFSCSDPEKIKGRTDFDFFLREYAASSFEMEKRIMSDGKPELGREIKIALPDGHNVWLLTNTFPLRDEGGSIIGTWGIWRDVTAQKCAEEELRASEEMLRQTQKMEAFGQLAGGIAHDFNNMLSVILGSAQLVELSLVSNNQEVKHNLSMVIDTSKKAAELTQQLLAFTRKGNCNIVELDFHDVVQSVVGLLRHTLDKRIDIVERLDAPQSSIKGDYVLLQNALLNLSINAQDAMSEGGTLTFSTAVIGPGETKSGSDKRLKKNIRHGSYLRVMVSDTGTGMDEKVKYRAFEPFFTTKPPGKGTGLGLASVYGTVKNHNGLIDFETEVNKGTTFNLYFPLIVQAREEPLDQSVSETKGPKKVLVIDDEERVRSLLTEMLTTLGYSCLGMKNGEEAITYYQDHYAEIDVIIVDLVMPGMNSNHCIKGLKQINAQAVIIISSGYNLVTDTQQIISKGIAGFLQKPFEIGELSHALSAATAHQQE